MNVNSIMKRVGRAIEFLAWAVFFALAALVLALRYWVLPDIQSYRDDIVAMVSRSIALPVKIGVISAGWHGLNPRLHLSDVHVFDGKGQEVLSVPSVDNVVSWRSLLQGKLVLRSLVVQGLRLHIRRDQLGALFVGGEPLSGEGRFSGWALAQQEVVLRDAEIEWIDEERRAAPLLLSHLDLRMVNSAGAHSIGISARPPAALGSPVELRALLEGSADPRTWNGRIYAELGYTDLAAWRPWIDYPVDLERGQGALRIWATLRSGQVSQATVDLAASQVAGRLRADLAPLQLAALRARLRASALEDGYEVAVNGLSIALEEGASTAPSALTVRWRPGGERIAARGSASARGVDVRALALLAGALPLPTEARSLLHDMAPSGRIVDATFDWRGAIDSPEHFTAHGHFADLAVSPSGKVPGFTGLSGSFEANESHGRLDVAARHAALEAPALFPQPRIPIDYLGGRVDWQREGDGGFSLSSSSLVFMNEDVSGNLYGSYTYSGSGPGFADLSAQLNRADARHLDRYLPNAALVGGQKTRDWLVHSIVGGRSSDVRMRLHGDLREFPFKDPLSGEFSVSARIENAALEFASGWPSITGIDADLRFAGDGMQVSGRRASILGVAVSAARASIAHLDAPAPKLVVSGTADGPSAGFLEFIRTSPVRTMLNGATDSMQATGRGKLHVELELPLKDMTKARVAGRFEFTGNDITVNRNLPPIERAGGRVEFTEKGVRIEGGHGRFFGGPFTASGATRADGSLQLDAAGDATLAGLRGAFDSPWLRYLSGAASYSARIDVKKDGPSVLVLSRLRGVASDLPPPLAKSAVDGIDLRFGMQPAGEGGEHFSVRFGRVGRLELERRSARGSTAFHRAALVLGAHTMPPALPNSGIAISGELPAFDLDRWLPLLAGEGEGGVDTALNVKVGVLDIYGKRLHQVSLLGTAGPSGWSGRVSAAELAGRVSYESRAPGRLVARLMHFRMPEDTPGAGLRAEAQPNALPAIDFSAESFSFHEHDFGRVELTAKRVGDDWRIDKLAMRNPDASFNATGLWRAGAPAQVTLAFDLNAVNAGNFLDRTGYPGLVKGGKAHLNGNVSWRGGLESIDYPSLGGDVELQAEDGQFLEIEPGLGKLISLMSLQSLPRRISLDFRDVFSKGFEFQRIVSSGHLQRGRMTVNRFEMRGAGAQVQMSGAVDIAGETQNLRVRVVPSLGDSASTVIGLVHPLLAIPAAIAQKVLKDPLGQIFAFNYSITGRWADPKVAKVGIEASPAEEMEDTP